MPDARVRASAPGLPRHTQPFPAAGAHDFHLGIIASIGELVAESNRLEHEQTKLAADADLDRSYLESAIDHLYERRRLLTLALSAEPARSLGASAAQISAASMLFHSTIAHDDRDPESEHAIARLLHSALAVVMVASDPDEAERAGMSAIAQTHLDSWTPAQERIAAVKLRTSAKNVSSRTKGSSL